MIRLLTPADAEWAATLIRTAFATEDRTLDSPPSAVRVTTADIAAHFATRRPTSQPRKQIATG